MPVIDEVIAKVIAKVVSKVTPELTDDDVAAARAQLRASAAGRSWIGLVCDDHDQIDAAFAAVRGATTAPAQRAAQKRLATLLIGHSMAEEAVLYPAMALTDQRAHASAAYSQQSAAKVEMAALDELEPLSVDYTNKLQQLWATVDRHVYEEETRWYPKLRDGADAELHARLTQRYRAEATGDLGD